MRKNNSNKGFVLPTAVVIMAVIAVLAGSALHMSQNTLRSTKQWRTHDQCLLSAQSGLEIAKAGMNLKFQEYYEHRMRSGQAIDWFEAIKWFEDTDSYPSTYIGPSGYRYDLPQGTNIYDAQVSVQILNVEDADNSGYIQKQILMVSSAKCENVSRTVQEVVTFGLEMTRIFDYIYFINNFGWFWGSSITANGDVRANGNFSFRYNPIVNGDAYGAVNPNIPGSGDVEGSWRNWSRSTYANNAPDSARPMNPANNSSTNQIIWPMGYDEAVAELPFHQTLDMPYLGDLSTYENYARTYDGTVQQRTGNGNSRSTLIDNVYDGAGPDGIPNTPDDGTVILIGTEDEPIEIDGPIVIQGDLIIKGYVTGQGCMYVGRNVHIADSVIYLDPPAWEKPDSDPMQTAVLNNDKDLVGFAAKGNIIIGDYTRSDWRNNILRYMRPNFTAGYPSDPSDYDLGYDSDWNSSNGNFFDGDYTGFDGGQKLDDEGGTEGRRYYESSLSDDQLSDLAVYSVPQMDGVYYNNHIVAGKAGSSSDGFTCNGSMVARDEGILYTKELNLNWDIRLGSSSKEKIDTFFYFPQTLAKPRTIRWWESP